MVHTHVWHTFGASRLPAGGFWRPACRSSTQRMRVAAVVKLIALGLGKVCRLARAFARALGARIGHLLSFVVSSRLCELYRSLHAFSSRSGPEEGCDRTLPSQCTDDNHGRILESGERSNFRTCASRRARLSSLSLCRCPRAGVALASPASSPSRHQATNKLQTAVCRRPRPPAGHLAGSPPSARRPSLLTPDPCAVTGIASGASLLRPLRVVEQAWWR